FNWNIKNNSMYNGTIMVRGSNRFKVGDRLLYTSEEDSSEIEYYIKSVSQNFTNFGIWITEIGVIRGINPKERFTYPVDSYEQYEGWGLLEYDPEQAQRNIRDTSYVAGY